MHAITLFMEYELKTIITEASVRKTRYMNSFCVGGHTTRKRGRMWQTASLLHLPDFGFHLLCFSFLSSCAASAAAAAAHLHQPTQSTECAPAKENHVLQLLGKK